MPAKLYKENGEILNITKDDIEKYVGKHTSTVKNQKMKRAGIEVVVDNNALIKHRRWNEQAANAIGRYFDTPIGIYGDAVIISGNEKLGSTWD